MARGRNKRPDGNATLQRYLAILQILQTGKHSAAQICRKLEERHERFNVTKRTIERDLGKLAEVFQGALRFDYADGLAGDADKPGRRKYWYFLPNRHPFTKPEIMDDSTAIVLRLAEEYLQAALPPSNLELLGRYFRTAKKVLDGTQLAAWPYKVKVIRRGPELIPPPVEENVRAAVYEALLKGKQIRAYYRSRDRSKPWGLRLHPLGLVLRDGIIYLVAVAGDHIEPAHFALHRMRKADLLRYDEARVPPGFDFESYVRDRKEFSYVVSPKPLKLKALFDQHAGYHLQESRLSGDQTIRQRTNGRWEVRATVADTEELRWWLRGFGSLVEVLAPAYLKREFQLEASALFSTYMPRKRHGNART